MKLTKAIVIPDPQTPYEDAIAMSIVERYMDDHKWDYLIYLGDFLDYFTISKFNDGKPGAIEGRTIMKELAHGKRVLERQIAIVRKKNPKCRVIFIEGNHENRAYQWVDKFPHLKGIIEPENFLEFKKNKVEYIRAWSEGETFNVGKAYFTHGNYTNIHHAKKMVEAYEENIFYGHTHDCNSYNKTAKGTGKTKVGQSMGTLCMYPKDIDYTKGRPSNWQLAFGVFYFLPTGNFNYYMPRIFNDEFVSPEGVLYQY